MFAGLFPAALSSLGQCSSASLSALATTSTTPRSLVATFDPSTSIAAKRSRSRPYSCASGSAPSPLPLKTRWPCLPSASLVSLTSGDLQSCVVFLEWWRGRERKR